MRVLARLDGHRLTTVMKALQTEMADLRSAAPMLDTGIRATSEVDIPATGIQ